VDLLVWKLAKAAAALLVVILLCVKNTAYSFNQFNPLGPQKFVLVICVYKKLIRR